ncbi:MAG: hypothetical protein ABH854_03955 [Candidatus Diapherotrites archaeon]
MVIMRPHGLFSFVLVLLFMEAALLLSDAGIMQQEKAAQATGLAMQIERASFTRLEIETAVDRTIDATMQQALLTGIRDPKLIEEMLASNLIALFSQFESARPGNPELHFYMGEHYGGSYLRLLNSSGTPVSKKALKECFKVLVLSTGHNTYIAEFSWTGGAIGSTVAYAEIKNENFRQLFAIPTGYRRTVAGASLV